ncbi:MAG: glycoside hydrolase family 3 C-terminal domain-containing protein [Acutalibacteraceae bacterium]
MTEKNYSLHKEKGKQLADRMSLIELISQMCNSAKAVERLNIKEYNWWNEGLHGVARAGVATVFPQAICLASTFDEEAVKNCADIIATEARAKFNESQKNKDYSIYKGLTLWSPNINIFRDPRWGRGQETYGEDPYLTSVLGCAFIEGIQGNDDKYLKASACAKHYCVHSGPENLRHTFNAEVSKKDFYETYIPAFKAAVKKAKVSGVMGAYNRVNSESCCASEFLINDLLRNDWGFDGYFVSDCSAILDVIYKHNKFINPSKGAATAVNAGCDLECGTAYSLLSASVEHGYTDENTLRKSVSRLMAIRSALGMFDDNCPFNQIGIAENASPEHESEAVKMAEKGIVLLENDGILPLKGNAQKILVTGYNADNKLAYLGNYFGDPSKFIMVTQGISEYNENTKFIRGIHLYNPELNSDEEEALKEASESDIIIMCTGLDSSIEGEESDSDLAGGAEGFGQQGDRATIDLPQNQQKYIEKLIETGKKIILLNFSGGCVNFGKYKNRVNAILQCWYPGGHGGKAIANLLFGKCSPSGKLPVTFYNSTDDLPDFCDYSMQNRTYRYFKGDVQYQFGYGRTYTEFSLEDISIVGDEIKATVCNIGKAESDTVLQLYVTYPPTDYPNPIKSLVSFKRIGLKPGEKETVTFKITGECLSSTDTDGREIILDGCYKFKLTDGCDFSSQPILFQK